MKLKDYLKASLKGTEGTSLLAALISIAIFIPLFKKIFFTIFDSRANNGGNTFKSILILSGFIIGWLILFKIIHIIINFIYHSINKKLFLNKLETNNYDNPNAISVFLIAIPVGIISIFQISRLIIAISEQAQSDVYKFALIYFGLAILIVFAFILRETISKIFKDTSSNINGFLTGPDEIKSIPIILTIITVVVFGFLIVASANRHSLESTIGNDIVPLSLGIVAAPLLVFLISGAIIYKSYNKVKDPTKINIFLKVCTIISRVILLSIFTVIVVGLVLLEFDRIIEYMTLIIFYFGFMGYQIHRLKDDISYLRMFRK